MSDNLCSCPLFPVFLLLFYHSGGDVELLRDARAVVFSLFHFEMFVLDLI